MKHDKRKFVTVNDWVPLNRAFFGIRIPYRDIVLHRDPDDKISLNEYKLRDKMGGLQPKNNRKKPKKTSPKF